MSINSVVVVSTTPLTAPKRLRLSKGDIFVYAEKPTQLMVVMDSTFIRGNPDDRDVYLGGPNSGLTEAPSFGAFVIVMDIHAKICSTQPV